WIKVNIEEGDGWVSREYVSLSTWFPKAESKAEEEARLKKEAAERKRAQQAAARSAGGKKSSGKKSGGGGGSYSVSGGGLGSSVANYALQFVGNPYVYGGTSLTNGTDCSGFTMGVYRNFGVSLPHSSGAQRAVGYGVGSLAEAQPGDLICYSGHVGLYIGGGQIVHASTAKTGIKVSNAGYRNILAIRRIF
ncbi:MAG: C40 family peptidase, partial [Lachnospiraceae bacterium]|nr:C40 family peptidase [Lachnospiraceae bacterium]